MYKIRNLFIKIMASFLKDIIVDKCLEQGESLFNKSARCIDFAVLCPKTIEPLLAEISKVTQRLYCISVTKVERGALGATLIHLKPTVPVVEVKPSNDPWVHTFYDLNPMQAIEQVQRSLPNYLCITSVGVGTLDKVKATQITVNYKTYTEI